MKPIKLVVSAFGPYVDKIEIDFTLLGEKGLSSLKFPLIFSFFAIS